MAQPVMIWRKFLPHTIYKGRKGGRKHVGRPRWVGPGRVVFHELVPGQDGSDRKQIVWVVLGNILYRASVHSVRPLSAREQQIHEAHGDESHRWRELTDMIPKRNYVDIEPEEPEEGETEEPHLPPQPGSESILPKMRFWRKDAISAYGDPLHRRLQRGLAPPLPPVPAETDEGKVSEYDSDIVPSPSTPAMTPGEMPSDSGGELAAPSRRTSIASVPAIPEDPPYGDGDPPQPAAELIDDSPLQELDQKKAKLDEETQDNALLDLDLVPS